MKNILKYVQENTIPEIAKENNIWFSGFNEDGAMQYNHKDLFTLYDKQIEMLKNE